MFSLGRRKFALLGSYNNVLARAMTSIAAPDEVLVVSRKTPDPGVQSGPPVYENATERYIGSVELAQQTQSVRALVRAAAAW